MWRLLTADKINCLLYAIRAIYHAPNPYHNYIHAIDVLQATYSFLIDTGVAPPWDFLRDLTPDTPAWQRPDELTLPVHGIGTRRAREVLRPQDVFAVIVAAMGHDVGHPGLSNAFMVSVCLVQSLTSRKTRKPLFPRCTTTSLSSKTCTVCSSFNSCGNMASAAFSRPTRPNCVENLPPRGGLSTKRVSARCYTRLFLQRI